MADTVIFFIVLLALSALFSGIEIAFFSLSSGGVRTMVRNNLHGAKLVERLKQKPRKLLIYDRFECWVLSAVPGRSLENILKSAH